jgi:adenylate cyclase class IV
MGLKVSKQNKITHFFLINVIKMYNDIFLEKQLGFMDILHINKQKKNYILNKYMIINILKKKPE